jgi:hypothetical protein
MKKRAIGICFVIMLLLPSVTAFNYKTFYKQETEDCKIDKIFESMEKRLENVDIHTESKTIFKETILELERNGFLQDNSANKALALIEDSDNDSFYVHGKATRIKSLESIGVYFYEAHWDLEGYKRNVYEFMWKSFLLYIDLVKHRGSYLTFGIGIGPWNGAIETYQPAVGYIHILGPDGEEENYTGEFYGRLGDIWPITSAAEGQRHYLTGIKGFMGIRAGKYFFGAAEQVKIRAEPE